MNKTEEELVVGHAWQGEADRTDKSPCGRHFAPLSRYHGLKVQYADVGL